jgi:hypothetical protein|tara:strand:+ start:486 stop:719 length:234 start_codon:yes stop_codon:yes gene_type:complete
MFCILTKPKGKTEYGLFTNEIFSTEKEAEDYAKRNKFSKDTKWKAVEYEPKYFTDYRAEDLHAQNSKRFVEYEKKSD